MDTVCRVLVADDHPLVRAGLRALFESTAEISLVGEASNGEEAVALAAEQLPAVVLMDVRMPGLDGIEATRRLTAASPSVAVLMLTMFDDEDTVFAAMRAGARGYLLKGAEQEEVLRAILAAAKGEAIFGRAIADKIIGFFARPRPEPPLPFPELTAREREVLDLVAAGQNNLAISRMLGLSQKTVANHVSNVLNKVQAADRAEAIVKARRAGLGA
jgi:DNA-binding NarL/FixJ family response regulator